MKKSNIILWVNSFLGWPHHDNGAFLFVWDEYVWINSERLDREKYSSWYKSKTSQNGIRVLYEYDKCESCIQYCLNAFWLNESDVDMVVYLEWLPNYVRQKFPDAEVIGVYDHHFLHAVSSYSTSHFSDAAILVMDGQWKRVENGKDEMVLQSIYHAHKGTIKLLDETKWEDRRKIGIGTAYEMFTRLLDLGSEGTTMWLSSYGSGTQVLENKIFSKYEEGYYIDDMYIDGIEWPRLKFLPKEIFLEKLSLKALDLELNMLPNGFSADIAAQLQKETEDAIIDLANTAYKLTWSKNLCISGWVWLNSVANTKIIQNTPFEKVFILPSCDDSWLALWAALYGKEVLQKESTNISNFYFGKTYSESCIQEDINTYKSYFSDVQISKNITKDVAELLEKWNIIGWFQGGSETWPRALWNRSILADPRYEAKRDEVNVIKKREFWRPLAPSVLDAYAHEYFDLEEDISEYKYMLKVVWVKQKAIDKAPAVVHIDNTSRIQSVSHEDNEIYHQLIQDFYEISGVPMLLNTSFNSAGEPIVETPEDAIKMFLSSPLDYLVLWNTILSKKSMHQEFAFQRSIELEKQLYSKWKEEIIEYENFLRTSHMYTKLWYHITIGKNV